MRKRNFGRIFNMTSVYGSRGTTNRVDYVTTKAALLGLTRAVALENLDYDITCHGICPGSVLTPGTDGRVRQIMAEEDLSREAAERAFLQGKQPAGRFVPARSVTDLLVFLCGPVARDIACSKAARRLNHQARIRSLAQLLKRRQIALDAIARSVVVHGIKARKRDLLVTETAQMQCHGPERSCRSRRAGSPVKGNGLERNL
jgi:short-subunit dehydrogenase